MGPVRHAVGCFCAWVALVAASPAAAVEPAPLILEFRAADGKGSFGPVGRTSILHGPTEIRVDAGPDQRVESFEVRSDRPRQSGRPDVLCRMQAGDTCRIDFGDAISKRILRVVATVADGSGQRTESTVRVATLDTHPSGEVVVDPDEVLLERAEARASPPDEVRRLVRVVADGSHISGLQDESFAVRVPGIRGARLLSVSPPDPERPKLIPVFFNVATYLELRGRDRETLGWRGAYARMVFTLVQGLRSAARRGTDAEILVVAYATTGRVFPPFRLHTGANLDPEKKAENDATVDALHDFLMEPPPDEWRVRTDGHWGDDFGSVLHTVNDLYLREFDGLVQGLWITGGWNNPASSRPRFLPELWPERLAALNPEWSVDEMTRVLERLDRGGGRHDEELAELVASLDPDEPGAARRVTEYLRRLDPGGTGTLHPHRVDSSPVIDVLFVPSDRSLREDRMMEFSQFVRDSYAGEIFRLYKLEKTTVERLEEELHDPEQVAGVRTVAEVVERAGDHLDSSYVVRIEVPNPKQNGARHPLELDVAGSSVRGATPAYMPYYTSSRSVRRRLADYLESPFKELRVLSAYEARRYWADDGIYGALVQRWRDEEDDHVRAVVFESWVVVSLKQLQALGMRKAKDRREADEIVARLRNVADNAESLPDPELARSAVAAAERYRASVPGD